MATEGAIRRQELLHHGLDELGERDLLAVLLPERRGARAARREGGHRGWAPGGSSLRPGALALAGVAAILAAAPVRSQLRDAGTRYLAVELCGAPIAIPHEVSATWCPTQQGSVTCNGPLMPLPLQAIGEGRYEWRLPEFSTPFEQATEFCKSRVPLLRDLREQYADPFAGCPTEAEAARQDRTKDIVCSISGGDPVDVATVACIGSLSSNIFCKELRKGGLRGWAVGQLTGKACEELFELASHETFDECVEESQGDFVVFETGELARVEFEVRISSELTLTHRDYFPPRRDLPDLGHDKDYTLRLSPTPQVLSGEVDRQTCTNYEVELVAGCLGADHSLELQLQRITPAGEQPPQRIASVEAPEPLLRTRQRVEDSGFASDRSHRIEATVVDASGNPLHSVERTIRCEDPVAPSLCTTPSGDPEAHPVPEGLRGAWRFDYSTGPQGGHVPGVGLAMERLAFEDGLIVLHLPPELAKHRQSPICAAVRYEEKSGFVDVVGTDAESGRLLGVIAGNLFSILPRRIPRLRFHLEDDERVRVHEGHRGTAHLIRAGAPSGGSP